MKDTESYVNKAEVKRKIKAWLDYRQSRQVTDGLLDLIEKLPVTIKGQLETTLESNWISVKDRLPDEDGEYLISMYHRFMIGGIYNKYTGRFVAKYYAEYKEWRIMNDVCTSVTHWMPLPEPPKE